MYQYRGDTIQIQSRVTSLYLHFYSHISPYTLWREVSFYNVAYFNFFLNSSIFNSTAIIETRFMKETWSPTNIPSLFYLSYLISLSQTPKFLNKIDMFIIYPIKLTTTNLILSLILLHWNREEDEHNFILSWSHLCWNKEEDEHDLNPPFLILFWKSRLYNVAKRNVMI